MWWLESHKGRVCVDFAVSTEKQTTENFQAWAKSAFPTLTQWITGRLSFYTISLWVAVWIWNSFLLLRTCLPTQCIGCKFRSLVCMFHLSWAIMPGKEINWLSGSKILPKELIFPASWKKKGDIWKRGFSQLLFQRRNSFGIHHSGTSRGCNLEIAEVILGHLSPCLVKLGLPPAFLRVFLQSPSFQAVLGEITSSLEDLCVIFITCRVSTSFEFGIMGVMDPCGGEWVAPDQPVYSNLRTKAPFCIYCLERILILCASNLGAWTEDKWTVFSGCLNPSCSNLWKSGMVPFRKTEVNNLKLQKLWTRLKYRRKKEDIFKRKEIFHIRHLILSTFWPVAKLQ